MKRYLLAALILLLTAAGCATAEKYLGSTEAHFGTNWYKSNKNQENFHAKIELDAEGKPKNLDVKTTSTTPEAAIAAAAAANAEAWKNFSEVLKELLPLVKKGAAAGS